MTTTEAIVLAIVVAGLAFMVWLIAFIRRIRAQQVRARHAAAEAKRADPRRLEPLRPPGPRAQATIRVLSIVWLAFPFWLLLRLLRPWRERAGVRRAMRAQAGMFMWIDNAWAMLPLFLAWSAIAQRFDWLAAIVCYIVTALLLHSAIAHSTQGMFEEWSGEKFHGPAAPQR